MKMKILLLVLLYCMCVDAQSLGAAPTCSAQFSSAPTEINIPDPRLGAEATACLVNAIGRGVGVPLSSCPEGYEKNGLLCYPSCKSGYTGVGPVCWQTCPPDLTDWGAFCTNIYGKGCCCTVFGCCGCPSGYTDIGCFCSRTITKDSYGRGFGIPMICAPGEEQNGALCYPACPYGYTGVGPLCWGANSPTTFPVKCNDLIWAKDDNTCSTIARALGTAGGTSTACIGTVIAAAVTIIGWPVALLVCGTSLPSTVDAVNNIMELTGAKTCPSSVNVISSM